MRLYIILSKILLKTISNDMGRKLLRSALLSPLYSGTTWARFRSSGKIPVLKKLYISSIRIGAKLSLQLFKTRLHIS